MQQLRRCRLTAVSISTCAWVVGQSSNRNRMIAACSAPTRIGYARLFKQQKTAVIQSSPLPRASNIKMTRFLISIWLELSIFLGQQNTGRRAIRFGNYPNLGPGNTECVHGHQPESLLKRQLIFLPVVSINLTPITGLVTSKVGRKVVARYPNRC